MKKVCNILIRNVFYGILAYKTPFDHKKGL